MKKTKISDSKLQIKPIEISNLNELYTLGQVSKLSWTKSHYEESILSGNYLNYGIFKNSELLGFIITSTIIPDATIELIAVKPDEKRQKLGTKLLYHLIKKLKQKNFQQIDLEVASKNPAKLFYQSHGFVKYHERKKYYKDGDDAYLMRLDLPQNIK